MRIKGEGDNRTGEIYIGSSPFFIIYPSAFSISPFLSSREPPEQFGGSLVGESS